MTPDFVQVKEGYWVNPNEIATINVLIEDGVRTLLLHAQDGTEVLVEGLWVGSVMVALGIATKAGSR